MKAVKATNEVTESTTKTAYGDRTSKITNEVAETGQLKSNFDRPYKPEFRRYPQPSRLPQLHRHPQISQTAGTFS